MEDRNSKKLITDSFHFTLTTVLMQIANVVRGFLIPFFLNPRQYGIFSGLNLIPYYGAYSDLGMSNGMGRYLPYYLNTKDYKRSDSIIYTTFNFTVITGTVITLLLLLWCFLNRYNLTLEITIGIMIFSLISMLTNIRKYFFLYFRSHHNFTSISQVNVLDSLSGLIFIAVLVWYFKLYGLYLALFITAFFCMVFLIKKARFKFKLNWDKAVFKEMIQIGLPLLLLGILNLLIASVDRIFILKFYNATILGYYAVGLSIKANLSTIPVSLSTIFTPKIFQSKEDDYNFFIKYFSIPITVITIIVILLVGLLYSVLPIIYYELLSKYKEGITAGRILLISLIFSSAPVLSGNILIAIKKMKTIFLIQLVTLAIGCGLFLSSIYLGKGILGIAMVVLVTNVLNAILLLFFTTKYIYKKNIKEGWGFIVSLFMIISYGLLVIKISEAISSYLAAYGHFGIIASSLINLFIFAIGVIPLLLIAEQKIGIKNLIKEFIHKRKAVADESSINLSA